MLGLPRERTVDFVIWGEERFSRVMSCQTFQEVASKYSFMLGLPDQAPLTEWNSGLNQLLTVKRGDMAKQRNPALKQRAERECAELQEASRIVGLQCLFTKLRRCLQEDRQETFEWEIGRRETHSLLPQQTARQFGEYMELREAARKKWPGVKLPLLSGAVPTPPAGPAAPITPNQRPPATKWPLSTNAKLLASLLHRELSSPLKFDRSTAGFKNPRQQTRLRASRDLAAAQIRTFQELFAHPEPPVDALRMSKDRFKEMAGTTAERRPDQEVGLLLYLLAILVARVRLKVVISRLPDAELIGGIRWALGLEWLDGKTKELFLTANAALEEGTPGRKPASL